MKSKLESALQIRIESNDTTMVDETNPDNKSALQIHAVSKISKEEEINFFDDP